MRLLIDTHIALWAVSDDPALPARARDLLMDADNAIIVSAASIWEIAIKHALGRDSGRATFISGADALAEFRRATYDILPISAAHAAGVDDLSRVHGDPFDRLLVAQAISEGMRLVTHDSRLAPYGDRVMVV